MKKTNSAPAMGLALALLLSPLSACSRDPGIAIPEANRHSLDTEGSVETVEPYSSLDEGEDSITNPNPEIDSSSEDTPLDEVDPPPPQEDSTGSNELPSFPEDPTADSGTAPVAEAPPVTSPKPSPIAKGPIENGRYIIQGVQSKKCIDVPAGGTNIGLQMQLWSCDTNNPHQHFTVEWLSEWKAYRLRTSTGKQLSVSPDKTNASRPLVLADALDAGHTLFAFDKSASDSTYQIRALEQLLVFDVVNGDVLDRTPIQVFSPHNPAQGRQQWVFIKAN